jgi:hypothetical protein
MFIIMSCEIWLNKEQNNFNFFYECEENYKQLQI